MRQNRKKYSRLRTPVAAKLSLHPTRNRRMPMSGTPIAEANLAAASKIEVAKLRSSGGNQKPIALALAGTVDASPTPSNRRAPKRPPTVGVIAAAKDATLQRMIE